MKRYHASTAKDKQEKKSDVKKKKYNKAAKTKYRVWRHWPKFFFLWSSSRCCEFQKMKGQRNIFLKPNNKTTHYKLSRSDQAATDPHALVSFINQCKKSTDLEVAIKQKEINP